MNFLFFLFRWLLSLRYRIKITGNKHLKHDGPLLILPNHVALVDPQIVMSFISKYICLRPVASALYTRPFLLRPIFWLLKTISIQNLEQSHDTTSVKNTFGEVVRALKNGDNVLIYPSGRVYRQGFESIIGKQAVYQIVSEMPTNTKIIGIRTTGLWGSMWSMAWDNGKTGVINGMFKALFLIVANGVFFSPRRQVHLEIEDITQEINKNKKISLHKLNTFLENFYNKLGEETCVYKKHYFYFNDIKNKKIPALIFGSLRELEQGSKNTLNFSEIPEDTQIKINTKIAQMKDISLQEITPESRLILDLYFDSLDLAELKAFTQSNFPGRNNPSVLDLKTVGDVYMMTLGKRATSEAGLPKCKWDKQEERTFAREKIGKQNTILALWKHAQKNGKNKNVLWDEKFGMQTVSQVRLKSYLLASYIKQFPQVRIGVMLPSIASVPLLLLGIYLAKKTPVLFNWTVPEEAFDHCVKISGVSHILTSRVFFDRIKTPALEKYVAEEKFIFLEDLLKNISFITKIRAFISSVLFSLPKEYEENEAVMLFTSGSESFPKAVTLTHKNICSNIRGTLDLFPLQSNDILLGLLPPFHSFGLTVNTLLPIITGVRVVYTPDPNDSRTIVNILTHTSATTLTATPTFLRFILNMSSKNELQSLKWAVVGAEKCPKEVFSQFQNLAPHAEILEGYGITECSPVIALNPPNKPKRGTVGKVLANLECCIYDPESGKRCEKGKQGMIYISGPSVFSGYQDPNISSPFEKKENIFFYKTGDLGFLNEEGYLTITGRLKRFIKIAGEMVSLPFLEEVLFKKYGNFDEKNYALEACEQDGKAYIIFFSTFDTSVDEINQFLRHSGVNNLIRVSNTQKISEIPILGSGKVDYKFLKQLIKI